MMTAEQFKRSFGWKNTLIEETSFAFAEAYAIYCLTEERRVVFTTISAGLSPKTHLGHHIGPTPTNEELGI